MRRPLLVVGGALAILLVAGTAFAARGFSDSAGDVNTAPDITAVEVSEATAGVLAITLRVGNFQSLPETSWVNLWFDTDLNQDTGAEGDEALMRYSADGGVEVFTWNGSQFVERSAEGVAARFSGGVLEVALPRAAIEAAAAFGVLVVSSRGQAVGDEQLVASDFAPNEGRLAFTGPAAAGLADPAGDHDAAPDITAVRVSDAKNGWITFAISTPNYAVLPEASAIVVTIDADANGRTGDGGAEIQLSLAAGEIAMERWDGRRWAPDDLPTRARFRNAARLVSIDVHVSELGSPPRLRFALLAADVNTAIQGVVAVDVAPDDFTYWSYGLANKPALSLVVRSLSATPARPLAGRPFTVALATTRSDTGKAVTSGSVDCRVLVARKPLAARGTITGRAGRCAVVVPTSARGKVLRGTITIRSGSARVARDFEYVVR